MTEKPILFSGPMVRAILDGPKTQTRRVLKSVGDLDRVFQMGDGSWHVTDSQGGHMSPVTIPYAVGDRLWVREAWRSVTGYDDRAPRDIPDGTPVHFEADAQADAGWKWGRRRPSMFMCRWMSRISIEVTAVKVERLQDISEDDAKAEGAPDDTEGCDHPRRTCQEAGCIGRYWKHHRAGFAQIWFDINGAESWRANPWVAAYTFKRVTP